MKRKELRWVNLTFIYTSIAYTGIQLVRSPPATHAYTTNYGVTKSIVKNMMSDLVMPARPPRNKNNQATQRPHRRETNIPNRPHVNQNIKAKPPVHGNNAGPHQVKPRTATTPKRCSLLRMIGLHGQRTQSRLPPRASQLPGG